MKQYGISYVKKDNQERIKRDQENIKRVDAQTKRYFKCR